MIDLPRVDGERIIITAGELAPSEFSAYASALASACARIQDTIHPREHKEASAAARERFLREHPDAVAALMPSGRWAPERTGVGTVTFKRGSWCARIHWDGALIYDTADIIVLRTWPVPITYRASMGRIAHLWRGGDKALCGELIRDTINPLPTSRPCPRCAAREAETLAVSNAP